MFKENGNQKATAISGRENISNTLRVRLAHDNHMPAVPFPIVKVKMWPFQRMQTSMIQLEYKVYNPW